MLYSLTRLLLAPLVRMVYRPVVRGRSNVPRRGPVIFASNHLSFVDSIVIALLAPRPVHFLAKDTYFTGPGLQGTLTRCFFAAFGSVPVDRSGHRSAQAALGAAERILAGGHAFGIYPEGHAHWTAGSTADGPASPGWPWRPALPSCRWR